MGSHDRPERTSYIKEERYLACQTNKLIESKITMILFTPTKHNLHIPERLFYKFPIALISRKLFENIIFFP